MALGILPIRSICEFQKSLQRPRRPVLHLATPSTFRYDPRFSISGNGPGITGLMSLAF